MYGLFIHKDLIFSKKRYLTSICSIGKIIDRNKVLGVKISGSINILGGNYSFKDVERRGKIWQQMSQMSLNRELK